MGLAGWSHLSELVELYPLLWPAFALLAGLLVGSFLNVVIYRLPRMMEAGWQAECRALLAADDTLVGNGAPVEIFNLAVPRSRCPRCAVPIRAWQNIPLLSYAILRGQCRGCKTPIGIRYPLVELAAGLLAVAAAWQFGWTMQSVAAMLFGWALLTLAMIDIDHQLLPDSITLPLLWLGLLLNATAGWVPLADAVWGAAAGYLLLWAVFWLFKWATGKDGMGHGDFKLLAALGAWLGWQQLALIVVLSSAVGAVVGTMLILVQGRDRAVPIPFGPYLAAAGWIALFWGDVLVSRYLQFAGL